MRGENLSECASAYLLMILWHVHSFRTSSKIRINHLETVLQIE
jgi:hypothetical protein